MDSQHSDFQPLSSNDSNLPSQQSQQTPSFSQPNQFQTQQLPQQQQHQQQQQQPQPQQQHGGIQITPQFLASLTPQQLQNMRGNPQVQEMIKQMILRQQHQQQQLNNQNKGMNTPQAPHQQQFSQQQQQQQQPLPTQQQQSFMDNPNDQRQQFLANSQGLHNLSQGSYRQQLDNFPQNSPPLPSQMGQPQQQQGGQNEAIYRQDVPNQMSPHNMHPQVGGLPGSLPVNNLPNRASATGGPGTLSNPSHQFTADQVNNNPLPFNGVTPVVGGQSAGVNPHTHLYNQQQPEIIRNSSINQAQKINSSLSVPLSLASSTSQELANKIPMTQIKSFNQWSSKLTSEGKPVPLDTKVYETIIKKDGDFLANSSKQNHDMKTSIENLAKDLQHYNQVKQLRMGSIQLSSKNQQNNSIWGEGYQGYGNGVTNTSTKLIIPGRDYTDREINEKVSLQNLKGRNYVPIRLEFDQERDQFKLRDTFLWDLNEEIISVEEFTNQLLQDYKFISKLHYPTIVNSIKEQIQEFQQKPNKTTGEIRIPIKIDIVINNTQLIDQFEWDILNSNENDPEEFATIMCDELFLPGEYSTAIAHSIREQCQMYHKALILSGFNFDGTPITDDNIRNHLLPPLRLVSKDYQVVDDFFSILRNPTNVNEFSPQLIKLTELEVERKDKEMERDSRRKRRHNYNEDIQINLNGGVGGGGNIVNSAGSFINGGNNFGSTINTPNITSSTTANTSSSRGFGSSRRNAAHIARGNTAPDLSTVPKTFRTPAPSSVLPGGIDLGVPEIYQYDEIFVNKIQIRNPNYKPPSPELIINDKVDYDYDPLKGTFMVTIKTK
ncbi:SNF5 [Candida pseudojiufengensis]|uniref:SNF5 n=1 Tax=Candida pseudojiufengensis TaxID=497109 RepID=UPI0022242CC6|nr:SNF5 [Candida pseudojiufengensis]KAI5966933.1 SNF5 [Candida pseudojiufengensis]